MKSDTIVCKRTFCGIASVDCLKLFFALCVVAIHIRTFMNLKYADAIDWLIACAVPFFFVTSGYLMGKKQLEANERSIYFRKKAFKVFKILLLWILIYLPLDLYELSLSGRLYDVKEFMFYLWGILTAGVGITGWPLWYLYTLGVTLFIFSFFVKKRWLILSLAVACYVVGYAVSRKIIIPHPAFTSLISNSLNGGGILLRASFCL